MLLQHTNKLAFEVYMEPFKKHVTRKLTFLNPLSSVSHFVIFSQIPTRLCYSLKSDQLHHETEEDFYTYGS